MFFFLYFVFLLLFYFLSISKCKQSTSYSMWRKENARARSWGNKNTREKKNTYKDPGREIKQTKSTHTRKSIELWLWFWIFFFFFFQVFVYTRYAVWYTMNKNNIIIDWIREFRFGTKFNWTRSNNFCILRACF